MVLLAAAIGACGSDASGSGVMTETGAQTPVLDSMMPGGAMMPGAMAPGEMAAAPPDPTTTAGEETNDGMVPLEPADGEGGDGAMMTGSSGDPPEEMPPAEEPPMEEPPAEEPPAEEPPVEEPPVEEPPAFAPCPTDGSPCRIMPLGDSITHGFIPGTATNESVGGYRVELFRQAVLDGHAITFVGPQQPNGPATVEGQPFPRNHAGISGDTVPGVSGRVDAAIAATDPHIILLHIGTNQLAGGLPGGLLGDLGELVDQISEDAPDALLIVAQIIPRQQGNQPTQAYNAGVAALVAERAARGEHLISVDMFTPFAGDPALLGDNLHPSEAGYNAMGQIWYEAIEGLLP